MWHDVLKCLLRELLSYIYENQVEVETAYFGATFVYHQLNEGHNKMHWNHYPVVSQAKITNMIIIDKGCAASNFLLVIVSLEDMNLRYNVSLLKHCSSALCLIFHMDLADALSIDVSNRGI